MAAAVHQMKLQNIDILDQIHNCIDQRSIFKLFYYIQKHFELVLLVQKPVLSLLQMMALQWNQKFRYSVESRQITKYFVVQMLVEFQTIRLVFQMPIAVVAAVVRTDLPLQIVLVHRTLFS